MKNHNKKYNFRTFFFKICTKCFSLRFVGNFAILILLLLTSCRKFVQIPAPETQLVTSSVFSNNNTATAALTAIYNQMNSNAESYINSRNFGLSADELKNYNTANIPIYTNSLTVNTGPFGSWISAYSYIYKANAIIAGLQQYTKVNKQISNQLTGESLFIRAFWHFYLTNVYGDVPLALTTDYTVNDKLSRTPRIQVLQQVITDLINALPLLNSNYIDISDTSSTTERVRPNKSAAQALLARAYLYLAGYSNGPENYQNAVDQSTEVISNNLYSLSPLTGPSSVFKKNSTEAIWQLQNNSPTSNYATPDGQGFILISAPSNASNGSATISTQLMSSFESGDLRKINWIGSITTASAPITTYYFPYKYKDRNVTSASEYTMVLRLAEQYLIRAEAEAQLGKIAQAAADLNAVRTRAGLPFTTDNTTATLLTAILHERQIELFSEWGHRWFDLARTKTINSVMGSPLNICQDKGGIWNSDGHQQLYPIPLTDINRDPNLSQNPGY